MGYSLDFTAHLVAIFFSLGTVVLIITLYFTPLPIPADLSLRTSQSITNALVALLATALLALYNHCLRSANNASLQEKLQHAQLSLTRLNMHSKVDSKSIIGLFKAFWNNGPLRRASGSYLLLILALSLVAFPLTTVLVLDIAAYPGKTINNSSFILGSGVPLSSDTCGSSLTNPNCTYNIAVAALHNQVVNAAPYTIAGVTLVPPYGTRGLPYDAFRTFSAIASASRFGDESSRYCLPVMPPQSVFCSEDDSGTRVNYDWDGKAQLIEINPTTNWNDTLYRIDVTNGTMGVAMSQVPTEYNLTIVTGSGKYADVLSQLAYGRDAAASPVTFVCNITTDWSWKWVDFTYGQGQSNFTISEEACTTGSGGLQWLAYALEATTSLSSMIDGYSKLINADLLTSTASFSTSGSLVQQAFQDYANAANMTMMESLFSQMYEIVLTAWTATAPPGSNYSVIQTKPAYHKYTVSVPFSITSLFALLAAVCTLVATSTQALLWLTATRRISRRGLKLLDPIELLATIALRDLQRSSKPEAAADPQATGGAGEALLVKNGPATIRLMRSHTSIGSSSVHSRSSDLTKEINEIVDWLREISRRDESAG